MTTNRLLAKCRARDQAVGIWSNLPNVHLAETTARRLDPERVGASFAGARPGPGAIVGPMVGSG